MMRTSWLCCNANIDSRYQVLPNVIVGLLTFQHCASKHERRVCVNSRSPDGEIVKMVVEW
ncbi:hypothetical protein Leryth_016838 [Lithospermum erythrorhizon]|nr:hypothetical protein Leryth_016838 [Lithospermum erythrorhizon]